MSETSVNGRAQRKTLANQLDRLDAILDGLAEALEGAVADAVKMAVTVAAREAVQAALHEVLTSPDLLRALATLAAPPPPAPSPAPVGEKKPSALRRLVERARRACAWAGGKVAAAGGWVGRKAAALTARLRGRVVRAYRRARAAAGWAWQSRRAVALAAGVGLLAGLGSYAAGPVAASVLCGLFGLTIALAAQAALPVLRLLAALGGP